MDAPLNFLFIEDSHTDFHLMERHLRKNGMNARCHRVASQGELERSLAATPWDAVLSDYHTPGMAFEKNLAFIRSALPDIPIILVSGNVGEEKAVELLRLGVTDFILKDNLTRLVPAIQRALQEAAELQAKLAAERALRCAESELRAHRDRLEELVAQRTAALAEANRLLAEDIQERQRVENALFAEKQRALEAVQEAETERRRLDALLEAAPVGIVMVDAEGRIVRTNRENRRIWGDYPATRNTGEYVQWKGWWSDGTARQGEQIQAHEWVLARALHGEEAPKDTIEIEPFDAPGHRRNILISGAPVHDADGRIIGSVAAQMDITDRVKTEKALRESEERFRATFENAPLGIAEARLDGAFVNANPKLLDILGYSIEEFKRLSVAEITHPADREQAVSNFQKLVSGQFFSCVSERRYIRNDGSFIWMNVTTSLRHLEGVPKYVIGILEDVTARRRAEEDLRRALEHSYHLANHDALTGLANRAKFNERLQDAVCYAKRDGHLVAVHLLDLDRFKSINDTLGHHAGDLLLIEVAHRIKGLTRSTDVVARLGGDEFVIIQTHLTTPSAAGILGEKIVEELGRVFVLEGQEVHSGTSIGIALFPNDAGDAGALVKLADLALYEAKSRGRYNYQFYRQEMGAALDEAQLLEQELRHALRDGQFCLHYQPQFDLQSGRISGVEALIRWQHPEKGLLAAAEFIQNAENSGLMPSIGEWTLRTACRQYMKWMDVGLEVPLILNVSLRQLRHPRFLQTLRSILKDAGISPSMLRLETRESVLWDPKFSMQLLKEAKDVGIQFALDNFGAELAALSSLHRFSLDVVKPGRGLIKELPRGEQQASVLAAVISVAHEMKISVCAEGIETADQLAAVKKYGCDAAQGFLLSSPLSEGEMEQLVRRDLARYHSATGAVH